jgi:hypothetical protein
LKSGKGSYTVLLDLEIIRKIKRAGDVHPAGGVGFEKRAGDVHPEEGVGFEKRAGDGIRTHEIPPWEGGALPLGDTRKRILFS